MNYIKQIGVALLLLSSVRLTRTSSLQPRSLHRLQKIGLHIQATGSGSRGPAVSSPLVAQTLAHLSDSELKEASKERLANMFVAYEKTVFKPALSNEIAYKSTHYPLYHGCDSNFLTAFYLLKLIHQWQGKPTRDNFVHLRPQACTKKTIQEFLAHYSPSGRTFDLNKDIRKYLLSVNFALTGNVLDSNECSAAYCFFNRSNFCGYERIIENVLKHAGFSPIYAAKFLELGTQLGSNGGALLQIVIPKDDIDKLVYVCAVHGLRKKAVHYKDGSVIAPQDLDKYGYYIRCSGLLKAREKEAHKLSIEALDKVQGRLLLNDYMLNPQTPGLMMYLYQTASEPAKTAYTKGLITVFDAMIREREHTVGKSKL